MNIDDPAVLDFVRRAMVARIATVSRSGRPSITSLYFVFVRGHLWLGTANWTLAAREAAADPRVTVLLNIERDREDRRILRITGKATVKTEVSIMRASNLRMALKYILSPGGLRNHLANLRLLRVTNRYHAQSAAKGLACIIDVVPEQLEFI
ncbi:MAG: pyridoxamine 5'-phosphate oxidase family protein [Anaerolineae bacterium]|nr:pyridoxamine 5'-phosphate oxidase family protein [Anaerolineae bacterium]